MMCQRVETGTVVVAALLIVSAFVSAATACSDRHSSCPVWANRGECYKNRGYMHIHCADSCDQCVVQDDKCKDFHEQCPAWAGNGECEKNYVYMRKSCPRSCTFCQPANNHGVPHVNHSIVDSYWEKFRNKYPELGVVHG
ncbi:putative tyrosinase-like protein tyr-3 [Penaeus monodon]|uniref:putative tyrosinase-like protein tyr-3 n=1 Tax=Penaeus monodon TaxID=6687 RepID=UPI0018A7D6A2|nr:putative tyrosinase-like protein tyr-3 [Penaeus monodon]